MASTETTASWIFHRVHKQGSPGNSAMRYHPSLQLVSKKGDFVGHDSNGTYYYTIQSTNSQAIGDFDAAQDHSDGTTTGANGAPSGLQFGAQDVTKYGIIRLGGRSLRKARTNAGTFFDYVTNVSNGIIEELGDSLAFDLHRDATSVRGRRSSISSNVITLSDPEDARNFKEDMAIIASPNADMSSPRSGFAVVVAVDEDAGTVEVDDQSDITSFADNDYLARKGSVGTAVDGFDSHIPLTAPVYGSDSFRGVDRGANARKYAGIRINNTSAPLEENLGLAAIKIAQTAKGRASRAVLNPIDFWEVVRRLGAKTQYMGGGKPGYGYQGFTIETPAGSLTAVSDPDCPSNRARVLAPEEWQWKHVPGEWIYKIQDDGGKFFLRTGGADQIEGRVAMTGQTFCWLPGCQATIAT